MGTSRIRVRSRNTTTVRRGPNKSPQPVRSRRTTATTAATGPRGPSNGELALAGHELDATPHAAYDDMQNLAILFENGLA